MQMDLFNSPNCRGPVSAAQYLLGAAEANELGAGLGQLALRGSEGGERECVCVTEKEKKMI